MSSVLVRCAQKATSCSMGEICKVDKHQGGRTTGEQKDSEVCCRICASPSDEEMLGIYSQEDSYIAEKIARCLPIIVLPTDELPLFICQNCMRKLNTCYDLIITALKAEIFLKAKFSSFQNTVCPEESRHDHFLKVEMKDEIQKERNISTEDQDFCKEMVIYDVFLEDNSSVKTRRLTEKLEQNNMEIQPDDNEDLLQRETGQGRSDPEEKMWAESCREKIIEVPLLPSLNINGPTTCDLCYKTFLDMDEFDEHISNFHFLTYNWKCRLCDAGFTKSDELLSHKISKHPYNMLSCGKCDIRNSKCMNVRNEMEHKNEVLKLSRTTHSENNALSAKSNIKFSCSCVNFENRNLLHSPSCKLKTAVEEEAEVPEIPLVSESKYASDLGAVHFSCNTCDTTFASHLSFSVHKRRCQTEKETVKYTICGKTSYEKQIFQIRPKVLGNRMQLQSSMKQHMCDLCGRTYSRYANMLKHRKLHKPPNQWEHMCNHCEAKFEKLNDLMAHIERSHDSLVPEHENEPNKLTNKKFKWICRFCGKRISTKLSLQDHERIHTGVKPFICEWCGRDFRSRTNLIQHHLTHTGDRKHTCEVCGKKFARKSFIVQHMRVHTGEKPFTCNICGHRFTQAGDMRRHRRRHTEVKIDACRIDISRNEKIHIKIDT